MFCTKFSEDWMTFVEWVIKSYGKVWDKGEILSSRREQIMPLRLAVQELRVKMWNALKNGDMMAYFAYKSN